MQKIQSYEVFEKIGSGGMGTVYRGRHEFRKNDVAIKSLNPQYCDDPAVQERFRNEAVILNQLDHPNIVKVFDLVKDEMGNLHLVMEFVPGRALDKVIGKEIGPIPYKKALPIFIEILEGIQYAHDHQVVHRDLKPSNILLTPDNHVKVTDFGIAKIAAAGKLTATGTKMGTLQYMSPEAVQGLSVDERGDIFSLGVTLFEMLSGRLPFDEETHPSDFSIMKAIVEEELPDPRDYYPPIPDWLVEVVRKATAKKKEERYKNISLFLTALKSGLIDRATPIPVAPKPKLRKEPPKPIQSRQLSNPVAPPKIEEPEKSTGSGFAFVVIMIIVVIIIVIATNQKPKPPIFPTTITSTQKDSVPKQVELKLVSLDLDWVHVSGGSFMMGDASSDYAEVKPAHQVSVSGFDISKSEVTFEQYDVFCSETNRSKPSDNGWGRGNKPAIKVSWFDAKAFCEWLGKKNGKRIRLPFEAEWEYAARGGANGGPFVYAGGNDVNTVGWNANNAKGSHVVASKRPNALGLYDMSGNVSEWCEDWYDLSYYDASPSTNPHGPSFGQSKVIRGGSWADGEQDCRVTMRAGDPPSRNASTVGFRCVRY